MTNPFREGKPKRSQPEKDKHQIDQNLKRVYENMVDDDIPDRFAELLRKLRGEGGGQ